MGLFSKLKGHLAGVFSGKLNDNFYDELEEALLAADVGVTLSMRIVEDLRDRVKRGKLSEPNEAKTALRELLVELLDAPETSSCETAPLIVLVIGVNGVGKTTTLGKLAARYKADGKRVLLCAGDTFRAAAADQLEVWCKRAGVNIVRQQEGADSASVVFDGLNAARARKTDVILIDTAGRLQNKANLMNELAKIGRVVEREMPNAARETLLVLDATTGQNGLIQAAEFTKAISLTGLVVTKMDGTAKGGVVFGIRDALGVPIKWVGVGEAIDDLIPFDGVKFVEEII